MGEKKEQKDIHLGVAFMLQTFFSVFAAVTAA